MKDAILNGTGDSRYLKSKIPTGTTWEQALAMLNAGTFPVDLNGINSEGFQQLGTPLNKANLLKDAVVSKLGLTGDKTPNDMFGVLADVGNLHVWRKTVTTTEEVPAVPAGYTLGVEETSFMIAGTSKSYDTVAVTMTFSIGGAVATAADGTVSLTDINTSRKTVINKHNMYSNLIDYIKGKFVSVVVSGSDNFGIDGIWYVPSDATLELRDAYGAEQTYSYEVYISKAQRVTGYPYTPAIPAGTSVTYPVSTNRNAYQEGSDAKPAGYVLGNVVSGTFELRPASGNETTFWSYGEALSVSNDGTISISSSTGSEDYVTLSNSSTTTVNKARLLLGKYVSPSGSVPSPFVREAVYFIPSDAEINLNTSGLGPFVSKYQPVTGYPAIPAGTVIEYLGCLGDKARTQVLSYVGTGTSGESNPCSITATFPITQAYALDLLGDTSSYVTNVVRMDELTENFVSNEGFSANTQYSHYGKRSADKKSIFWYSLGKSPDIYQLNVAGSVYVFLVV